jgi:hypothetical protein
LFVDSGELQLLLEPDSVSGGGLPIGVATGEDGRRRLRVEREDPDKLHRLLPCCRHDNEIQTAADELDCTVARVSEST